MSGVEWGTVQGSTLVAASRMVTMLTPSSSAHCSSSAAIGRARSGSCQVRIVPGPHRASLVNKCSRMEAGCCCCPCHVGPLPASEGPRTAEADAEVRLGPSLVRGLRVHRRQPRMIPDTLDLQVTRTHRSHRKAPRLSTHLKAGPAGGRPPRPAIGRTMPGRFGRRLSKSLHFPRSPSVPLGKEYDQDSPRRCPTRAPPRSRLSVPSRSLWKPVPNLAPLRSALAWRKPPPPGGHDRPLP